MSAGLFDKPVELSGRWARVVLERGIDHRSQDGLTYSVPKALDDLKPGERVRAPLGPADRPVEGYVLEVFEPSSQSLAGLDPARIKPLLARASKSTHRSPAFPPQLISLAAWISQYYCTPIGMVLTSMMPAAVKQQVGVARSTIVTIADPAHHDSRAQALPPKLRAVWDRLRIHEAAQLPLTPRLLADRLGLRTTAALSRLVKAGLLLASTSTEIRTRSNDHWQSAQIDSSAPPTPTPEQALAADAVIAALGSFNPFLLHGVTGSGKTEVYLRVLERALARGPAIVLVPEIALTPQTASRFLARFGRDEVAVLHSGLTQAQRHAQWSRVAAGNARIVVGARSAIFAPCPSPLALIVVDEEHDASYKQDQLPRYHARDVALRRAQIEGCPVILGSATPSLESWHNAAPTDLGGPARFSLLSLPRRVGGGVLPRVLIVDLATANRERPRPGPTPHALSPLLEAEIAHTLDRRGQIILLINRRGFASYICCSDATCGWYMTCASCDVTVVYHREKPGTRPAAAGPTLHVVKCHHCQAEHKPPALCPVCNRKVNFFGFGTQRVEEELARKFPALSPGEGLLRLDADTMRRAADYFDALERFRSGDARALLGTQMIAKGLDFPCVELIGVINADTALALPDFRASERTFQLVSQVAGRAGRSRSSAGVARVVVQTLMPNEPAITLASRHDFAAFAARELEFRREAGLPPIGRMARIVCRDKKPERAERRAHDISAALHAHADVAPGDALRVKGPMPCPIARIADHYRYAIELLAPTAAAVQRALARLRGSSLVRSDAHTAVDVDPIALL